MTLARQPLSLVGIGLLMTLSSCAPVTPSPPLPTQVAPLAEIPPPPPEELPVVLPDPVVEPDHSLRVQTVTKNGITFTVVSYDRRRYSLSVADQAGGPGSRWQSAAQAGKGDIAAINGGFFTPEGKPLGLVITKGNRRGGINRASFLGSGFFVGGPDRLVSRQDYLRSKPSSREVLQTGPRLVWEGTTLKGLSQGKNRPRSFLLWDGKEHFALGYANATNLSSLASALKAQPIPGFRIRYALNLDGGRSSDLWVGPNVKGGSLSRRSWLNKAVRNYLVLKRISS